ncbi:uncharacterized protein F4807DRAFT_224100 [Annulohypoxylon truncatum]|uniref:uncharacterized protein n=1 Tax=Annulohypoxylon truncatum TaxID=327061 RepID=UPI0020076953|nr:uncharacterized protein F4807DRAFT_224100 [Annulohypoxylon truncatum]KAI1206546.1 hypothetical protein F4807DRAFT_224100 [Annulohypoxylon truncatum]
MAANMPQMAGGAVRPRPPHQQLSHLVYTQMMAQQQQPNHNGGWQDQVQANMRVSNAMNLISNSFLAMPAVDSQQLIMSGLTFERDAFLNSPDKGTYDQKIGGRVQELFKQRQAHEHSLQHSLNAQAAAQAQAQMMMNQGMMSRGMGQPTQGFQHLQQQMQPSPIPQQPHQAGMGMGGPGGLSMNPSQQGMQMRAQMPGHPAMASLSAQDRTKVTQLALARLNQTGEPQRTQLRMMLQTKLSQQQLQSLQQENMDPVLFFFQNQILQAWKGQAGANAGGNQAAMQMQAQQRQMNQSRQQMAGVTNGEFGPFSNVESIMNQQKAGLLAQEAGQMVVPASNGPGRNATPQPMGGVQGPNPGNHPGPNQPGIPNQMQQQFNLPQAQQLKMDQRAAQSQAQIRAQAQAKQMQGQPGGLNGPGPISQSPGMNTLNTPVRRTPIGMGQGDGQPQMGQPSGPFAQGLDPRFNQGNQRPPMGGNPNNIIASIMNQMTPEQRQIFLSMPPEKKNEVLMKWSGGSRPGQMAGRGQPQPNQFAQNNPMAQFGPVNNVGQQPNPNMPMNAQNQMLLQHQLNRMRNTMHNQNRPQGSPDTNAFMDSMDVPPRILEQIRGSQPIPQEIKKWAQLKQYLMQKNVPQAMMQQLQTVQNNQFQAILKQRAAAGNQMPQPNMPPQGSQPPNAQMPMGANPGANVGSFPGITITAQEMQSARNHERFKGLSDDKLRAALFQMKLNSIRSKVTGQVSGQGGQAPNVSMQTPHTSQPGNANIATSAPPAAAPNVLQQRHQNAGLDPNATGPAVPARNNRQPQNNRPQPPQPTAPPQKTGMKRASTDDVVEVPNPSSTPVQRPPSQQAKASGNASQTLQLSAAQLATLSPEQRAKFEAMVKNRQAAAAGGAGVQQSHMSEEMQRLKAIGQEEHMTAAKESYHEIPMSVEQYQDMGQKIQSMVGEMSKISKILGRWYTLTRDDNRARMFFRMRLRLVKQFADGEKMTTLKKAFSLRPQDLDGVRAMLEGMARDVASQYPQIMKRGVNQPQNASESGPQQGTNENMATPPTGQPAPLNAANLEKQTQALNRMHQRTASRSGQPPAAPTTSQPPFAFGAQSPNGQPTYIGKPTVTQADLHLPARKKVKTGAQSGVASGGPSANSSPQVQKAPSPEMVKRQASTEVKAAALKFQCPDPSCEAHGVGFATDEARQNHIQEEHVKPYEDPIRFVTESHATALGLDPSGKQKALPNASMTAPGVPQTSAPMVHDASKQGFTPTSRADATPMSREPSMRRQGSAAGSKSADLAKTIAGRISTPKPDSGVKAGDNLTGSSKPDDGRSQAPTADGAWPMMTVDPQDLFHHLGGLEGGGGGAISNMDVYRAITPNDTPESSKDSASSEPNSDVSEGVSLNLQLNMGLDMWNPFGGGPNVDIDSGDMDLSAAGENSFQPFSWDDVQIDWNKEFQLDTSLYSMDTT